MEEKTYKLMGKTGAFSLTIGIVTIMIGIATGVLLIIGAAKLLGQRSRIMF